MNWARAEHYCIAEHAYHSVVLASLDGSRVAHLVTWQRKNGLNGIVEEFQRRSCGSDGTPAALKESTHLYKTISTSPYAARTTFQSNSTGPLPHISLDFFNLFRKESLSDFQSMIQNSILEPLASPSTGLIRGLEAMHLLSSDNGIVNVLMGVYTEPDAFQCVLNSSVWEDTIRGAKTLSVEGTYSDILQKSTPTRLYKIVDVYAPMEG